MSLFNLLAQKRFGPFFSVQFLGALNDNVFKNTLVILYAFRAATEADAGMVTNLAAGLFILPFFLFSALAGQLADKHEKSRIIRIAKAAEIAIMALGAVGFFLGSLPLLLAVLFLMGTQSAFFGPVKYGILPQHLEERELMGGNALVETGTFLAILLGTLAGGLLAGNPNLFVISAVILVLAAVGWLASRRIPVAAPVAPDLKVSWNLFTQTAAITRIIRGKPALFNSVLGISWFWYFGATVLAQLPAFTKHVLRGDEGVVTLLLAVFSLSIGVGSILCAKLSRGEIELGLVPLGAFGMTVFAVDLAFVGYPPSGAAIMGVRDFLSGVHAVALWRVMADIAFLGISGSLFIVPLYALIQTRADADSRSRVIAANNIFNALFMVGSAVITMGLFALGFNTVQVILFTAVLNVAVSAYIFLLIPEFVMRFIVWALASTVYRLRYSGRDRVPRAGPAVIVANHVSFIDWFVITAACRRPVQFVMDHRIFKTPLLGWLFRLSKAIPIAPAKEDAAAKEKAFSLVSAALREGNLVCIFPEGTLTRDGAMNPFRPGVTRILRTDPVPVVPMALGGLWGSFFSRRGGKAMARLPRPSRRVITVDIGEPLPADSSAGRMEDVVRGMLARAGQAVESPVGAA
jgi:1-acyl-sn-glycerol-3-phosphate acyltransferase